VVGDTHLDVGCGFGTIPFLIACCWPNTKVIGIEVDKKMISWGKARYGHLPNLKLLKYGIDELKIEVGSISCINVLHHADDHINVLEHIRRLLKRRGRVFIREFVRVKDGEMRRIYENTVKEYRKYGVRLCGDVANFDIWYKIHSRWSERELRCLLGKFFKPLAIRCFGHDFYFVGEKR